MCFGIVITLGQNPLHFRAWQPAKFLSNWGLALHFCPRRKVSILISSFQHPLFNRLWQFWSVCSMLRKCIDHSAGEKHFCPVLCCGDWLFDGGKYIYHFINGSSLQCVDFSGIFFFIWKKNCACLLKLNTDISKSRTCWKMRALYQQHQVASLLPKHQVDN